MKAADRDAGGNAVNDDTLSPGEGHAFGQGGAGTKRQSRGR